MSISFDGPTKVMTLSTGTITLSVRDIWSRWVDWFLTSDNSKYLPAFLQVGGDDIDEGAGTKIPIYAFLLNGWRVEPQQANHTLAVSDGILLVLGGGDPFHDCGEHTVRINYQQPVQAISFDSGGGENPWDADIEGIHTAKHVLRYVLAFIAGKTGGGGTTNPVFRSTGDVKDRISMTVDQQGNRSQVILDGDDE